MKFPFSEYIRPYKNHSLQNRRVYVLRDQRTLGAHPQLAGADATEAAHLHVEEHLIVAAAPDRRQRELDVLAPLLAVGHHVVADAHQRQRDARQAQMIVADQVALFGQSFALDLHLPDVFCVYVLGLR